MAKLFDKISADFIAAIKGVVESTAAFEKARDEEKKARMSGEDKDKVAKLAAMMSKEKKLRKEEAEQVDEKLSDEAKAAIRHAAGGRGAKVKPLVKLAQMAKKKVEEEVDQIDELSTKTLDSYRSKARKEIIDADANDDTDTYNKRTKGYTKASRKIQKNFVKGVDEEVEQVDELSKATMGRYINKAATKMGSQGVTAGLKIAADEKSSKNFKDMAKREKGIKRAVDKLTKEEIEMIEAKLAGVAPGSMEGDKHMCATKVFHKEWNEGTPIKTMHADPDENGLIEWYDVLFDHGIERVMTEDMEILQQESHMHSKRKMKEDVDQLDELSGATLGSYVVKSKADEKARKEHGIKVRDEIRKKTGMNVGTPIDPKLYGRKMSRGHNQQVAIKKLTGQARVNAKEEVEISEARGRPKKAAAKDFTVHPVTKEKLMHNNPEHMKKIEKLQKHGVLEKPKTEAGQHIINQLQKAKTSMQGGTTIHYTHGESKHVSGTHAAKLIDKYQGMKPSEKEDFQKKISHSHEEMMKHV